MPKLSEKFTTTKEIVQELQTFQEVCNLLKISRDNRYQFIWMRIQVGIEIKTIRVVYAESELWKSIACEIIKCFNAPRGYPLGFIHLLASEIQDIKDPSAYVDSINKIWEVVVNYVDDEKFEKNRETIKRSAKERKAELEIRRISNTVGIGFVQSVLDSIVSEEIIES
jgi:hypothetical protein